MMHIPRWFSAMLVAVLLLCSAVVASTLFHQAALEEQIAGVQTSLSAAQGRLRKQQQEYAEYVAALPTVQAELAQIEPQAQAAYDLEQALRQQRKALRAENADLADQIAALNALTAENSADATQTLEALQQLQNALNTLQALQQLGQ